MNTNKKEISMKKGQKVRILRTNQVATIVEVELIRKSGKVHRYCHLKVDKKPDLWLASANSAMWFWPPRKSDLKSLLAISFIAFSLLV